jgi:RNA polymerase sigma-70 factor (ECF subfamily)
MTPPQADSDLIALISQAAWVRGLARSLVGDDAAAEDLVQDACVAALRQPPTPGLPPRPWLSQVLRNLARMRFRGDRRRHAREEAAQAALHAAEPRPDSPLLLVERVETQRLLADLVLALEEPYRSALLLRYYEGLSAADIAARLRVPAGTVRWRLKTGLDKLRAALDHSHGGDRRTWLAALAPLAPSVPSQSRAAALAPAAKTQGVLAMKPLIFALIAAGIPGAFVGPTASRAPSGPTFTAPATPSAAPSPAARMDRQQRTQLLQRIVEARKQKTPAPTATRGAPGADTPTLSRDYIRTQIRTLLPLLKECYENAMRGGKTFEGKLVVEFKIAAAPDIGGLVTDSLISDAESTITDAGMRECVRETMYAARFPAPADGGEVAVTYPFVFAPGE